MLEGQGIAMASSPPSYPAGLEDYLQAFWALSRARDCVVIPSLTGEFQVIRSGIRQTEIAAWLTSRRYRSPVIRESFHVLIEAMDAAALEVLNSG